MYQTTYHRPGSLSEAASLFSGSGDAAYLSGGHTLLPTMKARLAAPANLIDLRAIPDLKGIGASGDAVTIGAATTHAEVAASGEVAGAIASPAAVINALADALDVAHIDMPATPQKVWALAQAAGH